MSNLTPDQIVLATIHGQVHAITACVHAMIHAMPTEQHAVFQTALQELGEKARDDLIATQVPDLLLDALDQQLAAIRSIPGPN